MEPKKSIDPKALDQSVKPTDDFFGFVNNKWLAENTIPPEEARWGSFDILRRAAEENLKKILDELSLGKELTPGSDEQKIRDFHLTGMDMEKRNRLGIEPFAIFFQMIDEIQSVNDLARTIGTLHRAGTSAFWTPFVGQDEKQSDIMAFTLYQGGLGLPDRDYYINDDEKSAGIRAKYLIYIKTLTEKSKSRENLSAEVIRGIMELETRLARASRTRVELRDVEKQYNKMTLGELAALTPTVPWKGYLTGALMSKPPYFIVGQPEFFKEIDRIFKEVSLEAIKAYLRWHVLNDTAAYLGEDLEKEVFDFYGRTFSGATEMKPQWRRVLAVVNTMLDEALGKLYVKRHFSEDAKQKINTLVDRLVAVYRTRIEHLDWMGKETKKEALEKLGTFSRKLGYPDQWKDFSALEIRDDSYAANYFRVSAFEFDRQTKKIGGPVDRTEWHMPPQMVNAYCSLTMNEIVFPAAILQPPFFDPNVDDALNFGGIGSVIGHELTHGFDDQGALFDLHGNLKNWWTDEDKKRFNEKAELLAKQFDAYETLPGLYVNGKLTLGENIADLGGLIIAYHALQLALGERQGGSLIDGRTANQRFFINYAITERTHAREEYIRLKIATDPHSPSKFRVNGPISNMTEFYEAFDCKKGDDLWREPDDRVKIW